MTYLSGKTLYLQRKKKDSKDIGSASFAGRNFLGRRLALLLRQTISLVWIHLDIGCKVWDGSSVRLCFSFHDD